MDSKENKVSFSMENIEQHVELSKQNQAAPQMRKP